jgi:hypothetical protein
MRGKRILFTFLWLLASSIGWASAVTVEITTPSQAGVTVTTRIDTDLHRFYYLFDLDALSSDYNQIVFSPPMFPLAAIPFVASSVSAPGLTEWNIHGLSMELQFDTGAPPPRQTTVTIVYSGDYAFTGAFLGAPGDDNTQVTLRNPPVGEDDNVTLWTYYPELEDTSITPSPGESSGTIPLLVTGHDPMAGTLQLTFEPACLAVDHTIVYGALEGVTYAGQTCGVGSTGVFNWSYPAGSIFFLVVGNDLSVEGSYGLDSSNAERPSFVAGPSCPLPQSLTNRCD